MIAGIAVTDAMIYELHVRDMSVDASSGIRQKGKYLGIVDRLKLQKLDENGFDHFHFSDGSHFCHAMGYERFLEELSSKFPDERKGLKEFCDAIRNVGELISPKVLRNGKISDGGMEYIS